MVAQDILWILLGLLLRLEPGTGGSGSRDPGDQDPDLQECTTAPSASSPVQGEARHQEAPISRNLQSPDAPCRVRTGAEGRTWGQKSKNQ